MKINQIRLKNFRNYDSCQFIPDPHMNVIIGKNAQGKTNLLESIVLLSTTRSHRAVRDQDMIREGQDFCKAGDGAVGGDSWKRKNADDSSEAGFPIQRIHR